MFRVSAPLRDFGGGVETLAGGDSGGQNRVALRGQVPVLFVLEPFVVDELKRQELFGQLQVLPQPGRGAGHEEIAQVLPLAGGLRPDFDEIAERLDVGDVERGVVDAFERDRRKPALAGARGGEFGPVQKRLRQKFVGETRLRAAAGNRAQERHFAGPESRLGEHARHVIAAIEQLDHPRDVFLHADVGVEVLDQDNEVLSAEC